MAARQLAHFNGEYLSGRELQTDGAKHSGSRPDRLCGQTTTWRLSVLDRNCLSQFAPIHRLFRSLITEEETNE